MPSDRVPSDTHPHISEESIAWLRISKASVDELGQALSNKASGTEPLIFGANEGPSKG